MAPTPLRASRAWDPEDFARYPDEVRLRALRGDLVDAILGIGRLTTTTEDPKPGSFPAKRRIVETLEIWVDPLAAHARAAAESTRVAFLTNDGLERRMLNDREKEIEAREKKLAEDVRELESLRRELREDRQHMLSDFYGNDEFMGRR